MRFYQPRIDSLRALAFLGVFFSHALPNDERSYLSIGWPPIATKWFLGAMHAGSYGVDLFFLLSLYLITAILLREKQTQGQIDVRSFYIRRALRIWPLYFTFLALAFYIFPSFWPWTATEPIYRIPFLTFLGNWACVFHGHPHGVVLPLWSVSMEEQVYFLWPLLLGLAGFGMIGTIALGMIVVAFLTRFWLVFHNASGTEIWCHTLARLDPLAAGALLSLWAARFPLSISKIFRVMLIGAGFGTILFVGALCPNVNGWRSLLTYPMATVACVLIFVSWMSGDGTMDLTETVLGHLGRISFGLYVFHFFALRLAARVSWGPPSFTAYALRGLAGFTLTIALAEISYWCLEMPFLKLKNRFTHVPTGFPHPNAHSFSKSAEIS